MTTTIDPTSYEPPLIQGVASAAVAIGGATLAAVSLIAFISGPEWLTGWYRLVTLPLTAFGWITFLRFTRFDRHVAERIATLEMDCEDYEIEVGRLETQVTILTADVIHLRDLLANPAKNIVISDKTGTRTVPMVERNGAWRDALRLANMSVDYGVLPGRDRSNLTQDEQSAALKILTDANLVSLRGTIYRLTVTHQRATDALNAMSGAYSPTPINPDVNQDAHTYLEPDLSGWGESGEGV